MSKIYQIVYKSNECVGHGDYIDTVKVVTESVYGGNPLPLFKTESAALSYLKDNDLEIYGYKVIELEII